MVKFHPPENQPSRVEPPEVEPSTTKPAVKRVLETQENKFVSGAAKIPKKTYQTNRKP